MHSSTPVPAQLPEAAPVVAGRRRLPVRALPARPALIAGGVILAAIVLLSVIVPIVSAYPTDAFVAQPFQPPSAEHPFGTDSYGRDVFVRVWAAGRLNLFVALVGVGVPLLVGTLVGTIVGAAQLRWVDAVVMRLVDAILAFPFVILVLALVVVFGSDRSLGPLPAGLPSLFIAIFVTSWAIYARLARAQTLSLRQRDYVAAARLLGYSRVRVLRRHLLPGVLGTTATYAVADAILIVIVTASLPFLGSGVQPPTPEWGSIMYEGRFVIESAWWVTVLPGCVLALTGIGISLVADALIGGREGGS
jgi:peptide/nickel transport system permease protein